MVTAFLDLIKKGRDSCTDFHLSLCSDSLADDTACHAIWLKVCITFWRSAPQLDSLFGVSHGNCSVAALALTPRCLAACWDVMLHPTLHHYRVCQILCSS
jgi:hypothetical protein